jgi:hypothetical protein
MSADNSINDGADRHTNNNDGMKPPSEDGEGKHYRRKMFNTPAPETRDIKLKSYLVQFDDDQFKRGHEIIITKELQVYTGCIKFACQMTDQNGAHWWTAEKKSKDLNEVKRFIREFLSKFGKYTIKPVE